MTREPATTEHKVDTGPLPPLPDAPAPQSRPGQPSRLRLVLLAALGIVAIVFFVTFTQQPDPMTDQRPVERVKAFVAAVEAKDATTMLSHVEPTVFRREIGPEVRAYVEYIDEISFRDARYELVANDGTRAHVRMTATMHYRIDLGGEVKSGDKPIDTTFELSKIEGAWYLHSVKLPNA